MWLLLPLLFSLVLASSCKQSFHNTTVDHFDLTNNEKYLQRYFWCDHQDIQRYDAIFFYAGNEANVESYIPVNGLMFKYQKAFKALIVFSEHRFYGLSFPSKRIQLQARVEQAVYDHVEVAQFIQSQLQKKQGDHVRLPTIVFGGSYGGMLAAMLRAKFPHVFDGAIAASAPLKFLPGITENMPEKSSYWQVISDVFKEESIQCWATVKAGFNAIEELRDSKEGRHNVGLVMRLCPSSRKALVQDEAFTTRLLVFVLMAFSNIAMSNFPFENSFLTDDKKSTVPPFLVKSVCGQILRNQVQEVSSEEKLIMGLRDGISVLLNATKDKKCFEIPVDDSYDQIWDVFVCNDRVPQESYFTVKGNGTMFFDRDFSEGDLSSHCFRKFHIKKTDQRNSVGEWLRNEFFPYSSSEVETFLPRASKIVFSNGLLDPWLSGGVFYSSQEREIFSINITAAAHHLDLFPDNENDPESVKVARAFEVSKIDKWLNDYRTSVGGILQVDS